MNAADELRAATDALLLVRQRDARAWPIAEVLASMWQEGCLRRLLNAERKVPAFTPRLTTEKELTEVLGEPARVLTLLQPQCGTCGHRLHSDGKPEAQRSGTNKNQIAVGRSPFRKVFR